MVTVIFLRHFSSLVSQTRVIEWWWLLLLLCDAAESAASSSSEKTAVRRLLQACFYRLQTQQEAFGKELRPGRQGPTSHIHVGTSCSIVGLSHLLWHSQNSQRPENYFFSVSTETSSEVQSQSSLPQKHKIHRSEGRENYPSFLLLKRRSSDHHYTLYTWKGDSFLCLCTFHTVLLFYISLPDWNSLISKT